MDIGQKIHKPLGAMRGFTAMEMLVSITISLIVTAAMIALMSNSLGNTSRIVNMTKLTDDMRTTMQMLTRDVRRSSYNANAMYCYGNEDCGTDGSVTLAGDITISEAGDCFTFLLDRDHDGDSTENDAGGFRHVTKGGVGIIEMWVGGDSPICGAKHNRWVPVTDANSMDIFGFAVDDALSYTEVVFDDGAGNTITQRVRKLRFNVDGRLVADNKISRSLEDIVTVRNDLLY